MGDAEDGGGLVVLVDAADFSARPFEIQVNGTKGRAILSGNGVGVEIGTGEGEHWPTVRDENTFMNLAVIEMIDTLDGGTAFLAPGEDAGRTLEAIVGFHISHEQHAVWVEVPLEGDDRKREVLSG